MTYYNTTGATMLNGLKSYEFKAERQDDLVLEWYFIFGQGSPSAVHATILHESPITSIRRSINTLTNQGKLVKKATKVEGKYGRPEHVWELVGEGQLEMF